VPWWCDAARTRVEEGEREEAVMRALVVYESMWGNTEKVARAVADGLAGSGVVDVLDVSGEVPGEMGDIDLLVLGGPTHAFSMSRTNTRAEAVKQGAPAGHEVRGMRDWIEGLSKSSIDVATFDTKVEKVRHLPGSAARKAAKEVRRHHLGRVVGTESFYVLDTDGPLGDGELDRARSWGSQLAEAQSCQG
jgi:flavodoxin